MSPYKVKLCGMSRQEDIDAVNRAKPDYCGFIVNFPKSHRSVSWEQAQHLANNLESGIIPVAVTVNANVDDLAACFKAGIITTFQLHGNEDDAYVQALRQAAPDAHIIQAFRVRNEDDVRIACKSPADMILLDSGQGSGETFDWSLLQVATRPFMLAGGLGPENVTRAISQVNPWAVDMSSSLETNKLKDAEKITNAVDAVRRNAC